MATKSWFSGYDAMEGNADSMGQRDSEARQNNADGYQRLASAIIFDAIHTIKMQWRGEVSMEALEDQNVAVQEAFLFLFVEGLRGARNPHAIHEICNMDFLFDVDNDKALANILRNYRQMRTTNYDKNNPQWRASRGLPAFKDEKIVKKRYKMERYSMPKE